MKAIPVMLLAIAAASSLDGCRSAPPEPEQKAVEGGEAAEGAAAEIGPLASAIPTGDPAGGTFSLADATAGLSGSGQLLATIETDLGTLDCQLYEDKAPITVANFVGLARGLRPFRGAGGEWRREPAYNGTVFHRVIKGFMIQGGDWQKTGRGDPGYVIPDEVWAGARHDRRGLICMANKGPNTNGMQFFITDGPASHLDRGYTIFGACGPDSVIEALANVPVHGDKPETPPVIRRVSISRRAEN
ncbi:MAG: peptidylprolyl isomerase [Polyangiaceae bacterium]|nr:peptidylprolyl isomerase [Polyangiaceae bacterium]